MALTLVTAPTGLPLSLDEIKAQTRIDHDTEDALLDAYLRAAVSHLDGRDGVLGRALMTQTWDLTLDCFPYGEPIRVPLPPLQSVTSISYVDASGTTQTWAPSSYQVDLASNRIMPVHDGFYPAIRRQLAAVTVRFVAGYGEASDVPEPIRQAIMLLVSHWSENREPLNIGNIVNRLPFSVDALLAPYRVWGFA